MGQVNLALWFLHILAGNHHEVAWEYEALKSETLSRESDGTASLPNMINTRSVPSPAQLSDEQPTSAFTSFSSLKRDRESSEELGDDVAFSFPLSKDNPSKVGTKASLEPVQDIF